jgi:hypothetical protein
MTPVTAENYRREITVYFLAEARTYSLCIPQPTSNEQVGEFILITLWSEVHCYT